MKAADAEKTLDFAMSNLETVWAGLFLFKFRIS